MESTMIVKDLFNICEIELIYKNRLKASQRPILKDSRSTYEFLLQAWDMNTIELTEKIVVILLNHSSHVLGIYRVSSGSAINCTMDVRTVFAVALKSSATRLILAHNHPSSSTKPSVMDINLTQKMIEAGKLLDIKVLDHLIITPDSYCSMMEDGYANFE